MACVCQSGSRTSIEEVDQRGARDKNSYERYYDSFEERKSKTLMALQQIVLLIADALAVQNN